MFDIFRYSHAKGILTRKTLAGSPEIQVYGQELRALILRKFKRSLHIRQVDTGSCGACLAEIIAATNPVYDIQRFGVHFVASPRHADALLVTGPVSRNMVLALKKTYEAAPAPKFIITFGACAKDGGLFKDSYYVANGVQDIAPALHIPGCPPPPAVFLQHLLAFLKES